MLKYSCLLTQTGRDHHADAGMDREGKSDKPSPGCAVPGAGETVFLWHRGQREHGDPR